MSDNEMWESIPSTEINIPSTPAGDQFWFEKYLSGFAPEEVAKLGGIARELRVKHKHEKIDLPDIISESYEFRRIYLELLTAAYCHTCQIDPREATLVEQVTAREISWHFERRGFAYPGWRHAWPSEEGWWWRCDGTSGGSTYLQLWDQKTIDQKYEAPAPGDWFAPVHFPHAPLPGLDTPADSV